MLLFPNRQRTHTIGPNSRNMPQIFQKPTKAIFNEFSLRAFRKSVCARTRTPPQNSREGNIVNRTKIEWTDFTWNPITGCKHGCWYCYAKKNCKRFWKRYLANRNVANGCDPNDPFSPRFWLKRLNEPWGHQKPSKIFACSIADIFASWTPPAWRYSVINSMENCPTKHTFQTLTKNPELIPTHHHFPDNVWVGTTVTGEDGDARNIGAVRFVDAKIRFVSFEPLLGKIETDLSDIQWIIIGKLTGSKRVKLDLDEVAKLTAQAQALDAPVFQKNNLGIPNPIQEFPEEAK